MGYLWLSLAVGFLASCIRNEVTAQEDATAATVVAPLWGRWTDWMPCTVTCGGGLSSRERRCTNLPPDDPRCIRQKSQPCNTDPCPDIEPTTATTAEIATASSGPRYEWTDWSSCTEECGGGTKTRYRNCPTAEGGPQCEDIETLNCNEQPCPTEPTTATTAETATVSSGPRYEWTDWSSCTEECGGGTKTRYRNCPTAEGGPQCEDIETLNCNEQPCLVEEKYTEWSNWTDCSTTCGTGFRSRVRECTDKHEDIDCEESQQEFCFHEPCVTEEEYGDYCGPTHLSAVSYMQKRLISPDQPSDNTSALDCMWTIHAPRGYRVRLIISEFEMEECCEKLRILDGEPFGMPYNHAKIATLTGTVEKGTKYHSTGEAITLILRRNGEDLDGGFVINFAAVEKERGYRGRYAPYSPSPMDLWWRIYRLMMKSFIQRA